MKFRRSLLLGISFALLSLTPVFSQTPDTTTIKYSFLGSSRRWYNVVVTLRDKTPRTGYMNPYNTYSPEKEVYIIPVGGKQKNTERIKLDQVTSLDFTDKHFEQVKPESGKKEFMARELSKGRLGLYVFTEFKQAPIPIPVAGIARVISIPYDQSIFFLREEGKIEKLDRTTYREKLTRILKDNARLVEKLTGKEFKYRDIPDLIAEYNREASLQLVN